MDIKDINQKKIYGFLFNQIERVAMLLALGIFVFSVYHIFINASLPEKEIKSDPFGRYEEYLNSTAVKKLSGSFQFREMKNFQINEDEISSERRDNPFVSTYK